MLIQWRHKKFEKLSQILYSRMLFPDPAPACRFDADPDPHHFEADPDPYHFDADPDPTFHFDANPDPQHLFIEAHA